MESRNFLSQHKVFRIEEFEAKTGLHGSDREDALKYHRKTGRLLTIRRGLYWVVPHGYTPDNCPVDHYLIAGHISADSIIAYHSALELQGRAYSSFNEIQFFAKGAIRPFEFRGTSYRPLRVPPPLARANQEDMGVESLDRSGEKLRVTTLERCLVDMLDRPDLGGGWEEVWRCLANVEYLDLAQVLAYVSALGNATTAAKTGWYLQTQRDRLMVDESTLDKLRSQRPAGPHYLSRDKREPNRFLRDWNLVIPLSLAEQNWEEPI